MDYKKDYLDEVKKKVTLKRYNHTLGVIEEAVLLSKIYGVDLDKARIAASLHDYTKYLDEEQEKEIMIKYYGFNTYNALPKQVIHGFTAAVVSKEELGVDDVDILNAIKYHTIGRKNMSTLEKIIYIADFTEPNRNSEISKEIHNIAIKNLDLALYKIMKFVINDCINNNKIVPKESYEALKWAEELNKINEWRTWKDIKSFRRR